MVEPRIDGLAGGEALRDVAGLVFQVKDHLVLYPLVELVGVDIGAEDLAGGLLVPAQERRAGEADEDGVLQPALHLLVHVAALGPVAFIHKDVETSAHRRGLALEIEIELVDQRA
jgi:hypothetical protein